MNNNSNGVNRSFGVNGSYGVNWSNGVNKSYGVNNSNGVNGSYGVNVSDGVNRSNGVNGSDGVNGSYGVYNCFGVSNEIFVCNKKPTFNIFGQNVNESRWNDVYKTLMEHLDGWIPSFNNAFKLYIKADKDWKKVKTSDIAETLSDYNEPYEAWKDMPKAAIDYLKSLPEFDEDIFETVTGIKSDMVSDDKRQELLDKADELIKNAEELKKRANLL